MLAISIAASPDPLSRGKTSRPQTAGRGDPPLVTFLDVMFRGSRCDWTAASIVFVYGLVPNTSAKGTKQAFPIEIGRGNSVVEDGCLRRVTIPRAGRGRSCCHR